jgi:hypothetical protein
MLVLLAAAPPATWPLAFGGIGSGAWVLEVEPVCQDMLDWAEWVDQMEAWPEEPELTEETEMRGRWQKGAEGGRKIEVSLRSLSWSVEPLRPPLGTVDQAEASSSGTASVLISAVGVLGPEAIEMLGGLGDEEAHEAGVEVMEGGGVRALGEAMTGGGGGGH